jgi:ribonuclease VapC
MVIDTSAILAILLQEPDSERFARAVEGADQRLVSAATLVEMGVVALRRGGAALRSDLEAVLNEASVEVVPVSEEHARAAIDAYARFGRGIGHPAGLNFGDCFAYALARAAGVPLLYKGGDFAHTDIHSAL